VKGTATTDDGEKLASGAVLDRPRWITLAAGAEVAVKHAETTREVVFHGPARFLPCERGEERFLLTRGRAVTATWAGARPGAEVVIATPLGAAVYGDAKLDVHVEGNTLSVHSDNGEAALYPSAISEGGEKPSTDATGVKVFAGKTEKAKAASVDVKALVSSCEASATTAEARARDVLGAEKKVPLGELAAAHVRARKVARIQCEIAAAGLGTLENGQNHDELARAVQRAEARFRGVPSLR
jgi:hypothetical protein